jgi:hypothetical protein
MVAFSTQNPSILTATTRWKKAELIAGLRKLGVKTIDENATNEKLAVKLLNICGKAPDKAALLGEDGKATAKAKRAVAAAQAAVEADRKKSADAAAAAAAAPAAADGAKGKKGGDGSKKQTAIHVDGAAGKKDKKDSSSGGLDLGNPAASARLAASKANAKGASDGLLSLIDGSSAGSRHLMRIQTAIGNHCAKAKAPASPHAPINVYGVHPEEVDSFKAATKLNRVVAKYFRRITEEVDDPGSEVLAIWMSPELLLTISRALHMSDTSVTDIPPVFVQEMEKVIKHYQEGVLRPWCVAIGLVVKQHVLSCGSKKVGDLFFRLSEEAGSSAVQHRILSHMAAAAVIGYHRHSRFPFKNTEGIYAAIQLQAEARDVPAANAYVGEMAKLVYKPDPKTIAQGLGTPPARSQDGGRGGRATSPLAGRGSSEERFRGTCYHCKQRAGHRAKDCPDKDRPKPQPQRNHGGKRGRGGQKDNQQPKRQQPAAADEK